MHAPASDCPVVSTWRHLNGDGAHYFDSNAAGQWIEAYNTNGDQEALSKLLAHVEPLARSILEYRCTTRHEAIDELLSRIRIKLWRSAKLFNADRGSAFSFCARVISSTAASVVGEAWARSERFVWFDESLDHRAGPSALEISEAVADVVAKVRRVKTSCTKRAELAAQRWYVESFIDCGFKIRRHQASNAVMEVYALDHARARALFDLTMVAIRRELINERRLPPVAPASLRHTKSQALIRHAKILSAQEFTRLAILLRDVAPSVIYTVNPANVAAIRNGEPNATRQNLGLVLWGSPTDRRLL